MINLLNMMNSMLGYIVLGMMIASLVLIGYVAGVINISRKFNDLKNELEKDITEIIKR